MIRLLILFVTIFVASGICFAQPQPPPVSYPIALNKGGSEISNVETLVSTTGTITAQGIATGNLKFTGSSSIALHGIAAPSPARDTRIWVYNNAASTFTIVNNSSSASAANRIYGPAFANTLIPVNSGVSLYYSTNVSRWLVSSAPFMQLSATAPITFSSNVIAMPAATASQNGYLTSSNFTTYMDNWIQTGTDIYNTNQDNVWIGGETCVGLTEANCLTYATWCTTNYTSNDCTAYSGTDQGTCESGHSGCSWFDPSCSGTWDSFLNCTNISGAGGYRVDDGSQAHLQVHNLDICNGTPSTCESLAGSESACNDQGGCTYQADSCPGQPDQSSCESQPSPGCVWQTGVNCSVFNNDAPNCSGTSGCTNNDCASIGDQGGCESQSGCTANITGDCTLFNNDQMACESVVGCSWADPDCSGSYYASCSGTYCTGMYDYCSGDNHACNGTAALCNTFNSATCSGQAGCTFSTTPALNVGGDAIVTSEGYLQPKKTFAGAPTSADCDNDSEYGRIALDTTNERLYICNGASRGWDYVVLSN